MCKCLVWVFWWWYIAKVEKWHEWPFKFGWIRLLLFTGFKIRLTIFFMASFVLWTTHDDSFVNLLTMLLLLCLFFFPLCLLLSLSLSFPILGSCSVDHGCKDRAFVICTKWNAKKSDRMPFVYSVLVSVTYLFRSKILRNSFIRIWIHVGRIYLVVCLFVCLCILHVLILDDNLTFNIYVSSLGTITVWPYMKQHFFSFSIGCSHNVMQCNSIEWNGSTCTQVIQRKILLVQIEIDCAYFLGCFYGVCQFFFGNYSVDCSWDPKEGITLG